MFPFSESETVTPFTRPHRHRPGPAALLALVVPLLFACGGGEGAPEDPTSTGDAPPVTGESSVHTGTTWPPDASVTTEPPDVSDGPTDEPDVTSDTPDATGPTSTQPPGPTDFTAVSMQVSTSIDETVTITLEGSGPVGTELVFTLLSDPEHGELEGTPPDLVYTPDTGFLGNDTFTFAVGDGLVQSAPATVSILVRQPNRPPVAEDITVEAAADRETVFQLIATDPDDDDLTFTIVDPPEHGQIDLDGDTATYTPDTGFLGIDTLTFRAFDGELESNLATVTLDVQFMNNRAPVASDMSVQVDQRSSTTFTLQAMDPDGDALTFSLVSDAENGTATLDGNTATYTPNSDFHGTDTLQFRAFDGELHSNTATVTIEVAYVNRPPAAFDRNLVTPQGQPGTATLLATDPDGDDLSFEIVDPPDHGQAAIEGAVLTFTPDDGFAGSDTLTFRAFDGELHSEPARVSITVTPVNRPPVASDVSGSVTQGGTTFIDLDAADPDDDNLTFELVSQPSHGTATIIGTSVRLSMSDAPDFTGELEFPYRAFDGELHSEPATITVNVLPDLPPPTGDNVSAVTERDRPVDIELPATGAPDATLTLAIVDEPTNGTVELDGTTATYTPDTGFTGSDSFTYTVSDGEQVSPAYTVDILVEAANRPPVAQDLAVTVPQREGGTFTLPATDPDDNPLDFRLVDPPEHGLVVIVDNEATYIPDGDFHGQDEFTFDAFDGFLASNTATVTITVEYVNRPPVVEDASAQTLDGQPVDIAITATDPDGDDLTLDIDGPPANGQTSITALTITYTPEAGFVGRDTFTVIALDGTDQSEPATITIDVIPRPPVAANRSYTLSSGQDSLSVPASEGLLVGAQPGSGPASAMTITITDVPDGVSVIASPDGAFELTLIEGIPVPDEFTFTFLVMNAFTETDFGTATVTRIAP